MTGQDQIQLIKTAEYIQHVFCAAGIDTFHPVLAEKVEYKRTPLRANAITLPPKWKMDKDAIEDSFVLVDSSADVKSEGREHEVGFMRYCLWRPVVRISPRHINDCYYSIAVLEDDIIVGTPEEAAEVIVKNWGTWWKRRLWQFKMYNRCILRFFKRHLKGVTL
jgi:hypothetical protein